MAPEEEHGPCGAIGHEEIAEVIPKLISRERGYWRMVCGG
jgi:hypothetical protein